MGSDIIRKALQDKRTVLTEIESKQLMSEASIPIIESRLASTKAEAGVISKEIGFPVVMKIVSPDIIRKNASGGVRLGLGNATQVGKAYTEIMEAARRTNPEARIYGVSVQRMAKPGVEVIMGMASRVGFEPTQKVTIK